MFAVEVGLRRSGAEELRRAQLELREVFDTPFEEIAESEMRNLRRLDRERLELRGAFWLFPGRR